MSKRWIIRENDPERTRFLARSAELPELVASLLTARGIYTPDIARQFLKPNLKEQFRRPSSLPGCSAVAQHLFAAIQQGKKIVVYGDYDVDGITGCVILIKTLRDLGAKNVSYYIPSRLDEGYGLNAESVRKLHKNGCSVIITVDCGINSVEEAELAKELGVEMLITDHHTPAAELPDAAALAHAQLVRYPADGNIVSPAALKETELEQAKKYPFPTICGSATALKVAFALGELCTKEGLPALSQKRIQELIVLAAMGTVADVMPLLDENRALVKTGLEILQNGNVSTGLTELLRTANPKHKPVDEGLLGFQVQPRLNAAGRLGQAGLAVELLLSEDPKRCSELAAEIDRQNQTRRELENKIFYEAKSQIIPEQDAAFILSGDWHKGVIGIVAGRLTEQFHRPAILISLNKMGGEAGKGVGSGRSIPGFNIHDALKSCGDLLVRFGGHSAAAGLTIEEKNIGEFQRRFCKLAAADITSEKRKADMFLEGTFPLGIFTPSAVGQIHQLAPFGAGNNKPAFAASGVRVENIRAIGNGEHLSAEFVQGDVCIRGVAFNRKDWLDELNVINEPVDIAFTAKISDFNGKVELNVLDWRIPEVR
ncbi:MAG: single-stranded-DNA-specific exonuclease RecJ [Planctomycetaceae bacterium]|nr:single-stranded-DNA-specific exonuclease RecJ [Planctomycetaceae bacterium]